MCLHRFKYVMDTTQVDSRLAQITKQRMMDNGFGLDLVSLSQPPLHAAPLFVVEVLLLTLSVR